MKYIIDSRYFKGECVTSMGDNLHSDYGNETLEELRVREKNPYLIAVTPERMNLLVKRYQNALQTPFKEITEERYWDLLNCLPPARMGNSFFFVGEPYYGYLYPFCFKANGRYFHGERSIRLTNNDIYAQIKAHMVLLNRYPALIKGEAFHKFLSWHNKVVTYVPYQFDMEGKRYFLQNLMTETGNPHDERRCRRELAALLLNLRRNHYQYCTFYSDKRDIFEFFDWVRNNNYTLEVHGALLSFSQEEGFADFCGNIVEYSAAFRFRIYSRELLRHVINQLRTVKRRKLWE